MNIITEQLAKPWGELALYQSYASEDGVAFIDFLPEYPSMAISLFKLANILGEKWFTLVWYGLVVLAILLICLMVKKMKGNIYIFLASIFPLGGLLWDRFDIFPALTTILAVYLTTIGWGFLSLPILAIGVSLKVYPILLMPVIAWMLIKKKEYRNLVIGMIIFVLIVWLSLSRSKSIFKFHGNRGIQIESLRAIPKLLNKDSIVEYKHNTFEIR